MLQGVVTCPCLWGFISTGEWRLQGPSNVVNGTCPISFWCKHCLKYVKHDEKKNPSLFQTTFFSIGEKKSCLIYLFIDKCYQIQLLTCRLVYSDTVLHLECHCSRTRKASTTSLLQADAQGATLFWTHWVWRCCAESQLELNRDNWKGEPGKGTRARDIGKYSVWDCSGITREALGIRVGTRLELGIPDIYGGKQNGICKKEESLRWGGRGAHNTTSRYRLWS